MMLRGCKLKNTEWVIGLVIYTGLNTAIMNQKIFQLVPSMNNSNMCFVNMIKSL